MVVNIYEEIDDFHRELSETFIGGVGYINHKEKYFNISNDGTNFKTIHFDRIDFTNQVYNLYIKIKENPHACDSCDNGICQDRDLIKPFPKKMCKYMEKQND